MIQHVIVEAWGKREDVEKIKVNATDQPYKAAIRLVNQRRYGKHWYNAIVVPVGGEIDIGDLVEDDIGNDMWKNY